MKAVVGLGNPGSRYEKTRHNLGFMVVDRLAARHQLSFRSGKGNYLQAVSDDRRFGLFKPLSYMNLSGEPVVAILNWYKIASEELLVVNDDLDLPFGQLRLRGGGSSGGHRGLDSIIRLTGTDRFDRFRIGIHNEQRRHQATESFVLSNFSSEEQKALDDLVDRCADGVELYLKEGLKAAMNTMNRKIKTETEISQLETE